MSRPQPVSPDPTPRTGYARSRDTRARILAAALAEASEVGFHKSSLTRIAARAGVALGNVNYHFGSKRDLLRELMVSLVTDLRSRIHDSLPDDSRDFFVQERAGVLAYLAYLRENPAYAQLADEVKLHEPELYRRALEGWVEQFVARVRRGIADGALRPLDEEEIRVRGHLVFGSQHLFDRLLQAEPPLGDERIADTYLDFLRGGLAARS